MAASRSSMIDISNILGQYSIEHIRDELCIPRLINREDMSFVPPKFMYIKKLIPVVLDLYKVQYTCWSALFCDTARDYNLLHHIDPTTSTDDDDTNLWRQQDAIVLSWIYATISPYLLSRLYTRVPSANAWACLRDMCQQHNTTMQNKRTRFIYIHPNEDYQDNINDGVDLISALHDDVLIYILSLVADMKTAARTCLLSKRWTHVWTHLMHLDFNDPETSGSLNFLCYAQPAMDKFVDSVNRVIIENRAPYLDTLTINFPLNTCYAADIHNWLTFAFAKEVHNLDLNFGPATYPTIHFFNIFSKDPALVFNTTLTSLHLKSVAVKGPLLQWVLTNCLNLQHLSLHRCKAINDDSTSLKHLRKLVVSSLQLKHLEFFDSLKLLNIQVLHLSAPNLTSFILYESEIDVEYRSVPSFVDATFGGLYSYHIFQDLNSLSCFSSQLEKLSIRWLKVHSVSSQFPTFVNVRQLEIVSDYGHDDLILSTSLIKACPLLHTFKLKMMCYNQLKEPRQISAPNYAQENAIRSHQHLKVVEYLGYGGCLSAAELAICLARHAPMLQRFIFYTRRPRNIENLRKGCSSDYQDRTDIVRRTELLANRIQRRQYPIDVCIASSAAFSTVTLLDFALPLELREQVVLEWEKKTLKKGDAFCFQIQMIKE